MFYLHLSIGLISSKKYWREEKNPMPFLKGVIQVKLHFYKIPNKDPNEIRKTEFSKNVKNMISSKFSFEGVMRILNPIPNFIKPNISDTIGIGVETTAYNQQESTKLKRKKCYDRTNAETHPDKIQTLIN